MGAKDLGLGLAPLSEDPCRHHCVSHTRNTASLISGFRCFQVEQELRFLQTKLKQHPRFLWLFLQLFTAVLPTLNLTAKQRNKQQQQQKPVQSGLCASMPNLVFTDYSLKENKQYFAGLQKI